MPESLHALLAATREDIAAMRGEITASRQATQELATQVARLAAEVVSTRRDLEHHRDDDRRQMDALAAEGQQQQAQIDALRAWRAWIAGALAVLGLLVSGLALPLVLGALS